MSQKTIKGTPALGEAIKSRRQELGLTIEDAALKADVGTKSWCRYESGESIRSDKVKGICKALNWLAFPNQDLDEESIFNLEEYLNHDAWSQYLCERYGEAVAVAFAIGSDIILDHIKEDLSNIATLPRYSHLGQLRFSMIGDELPEQFLTRYDYEFLYQLKTTVILLRENAAQGKPIIAHTVLDELAIYLFMLEAEALMECMYNDMYEADIEGLDLIDRWAFELFDDMDIVTCLFSNRYLLEENIYHFDNWAKYQSYTDEQ
jgi:transcriptional regulator with XRE-family HTH domain